jgi:hypothetical protein
MIKIKETINDKVASFISGNFAGRVVVGVHYRGTDKVEGGGRESERVPYEYITEHLKEVYGKTTYFFVATDEQPFLEEMRLNFGARVRFYDAVRSGRRTSLHDRCSTYPKLKIGEDALIDCLLLSKCKALVRTESNLSHACSYFNPGLRVTNISRKFIFDRGGDWYELEP